MKHVRILAIIGMLLVVACEKQAPESSGVNLTQATPSDKRLYSVDSVVRGAKLFQEHCAQCHGPEAQGHPDWLTPGVVAAPPLNGTGNDWKRTKKELVAVIKRGVKRKGKAVMPGWKGRLNDQEIEDIITWFQALWPTDVYERWRKANVAQSDSKG